MPYTHTKKKVAHKPLSALLVSTYKNIGDLIFTPQNGSHGATMRTKIYPLNHRPIIILFYVVQDGFH